MSENCLTVVIPSFNAVSTIDGTLASVFSQSRPVDEVIVVDDASEDGTQDRLEYWSRKEARLNYFVHEKNCGGPAWGRNQGAIKARGNWVAFLDADDLWHFEKTDIQMSAMLSGGHRFSSCRKVVFSGTESVHLDSPVDLQESALQTLVYRKLMGKNWIANSSVIVARDLILKYPFPETKEMVAVEDYHSWLRIHREIQESLFIDRPLLYYREEGFGISRSKWRMFKKVSRLLAEHEDNGAPLGHRRWPYLAKYVGQSLLERWSR